MGVTIEECQKEHRALWNWIADETERTKSAVSKWDYFKCFMGGSWRIRNFCFACQFVCDKAERLKIDCKQCPIDWDKVSGCEGWRAYSCEQDDSPYCKWKELWDRFKFTKPSEKELEQYVALARQIANLPFKEEVERESEC